MLLVIIIFGIVFFYMCKFIWSFKSPLSWMGNMWLFFAQFGWMIFEMQLSELESRLRNSEFAHIEEYDAEDYYNEKHGCLLTLIR